MKEIWKDIKGYENCYKISNFGRIKSLAREVPTDYYGRINRIPEKILKHAVTRCGYHMVTLFRDNRRNRQLVHRLVAEAFLINPNKLPFVNHIDENKSNNCAENLEWCTAQYNVNYSGTVQKAVNSRKRKVSQFERTGKFIKNYESMEAASRATDTQRSAINMACQGKYKTAGGYIWKYYEGNDN